jgi:hypothetical protein
LPQTLGFLKEMITENSRKGEYRIILQYLKSLRGNGEGWMKAGLIRSFATPFGFVGFRGDRNVRELVEMGYLERVYRGKTFDEPGRFAWVSFEKMRNED